MPKITANGIEVYYEQHGWDKDADVLVLSNGVLMSTASWAFQTPVLSKHYRVLLYDCRGQWQSDHPRAPYSMELHADDLAALLDALKIDKAHLLGISYGAELSLQFALKYPERAHSLIVSSTVSHVEPTLHSMIQMWIEAAKRKDVEMFYRVTYPFNFAESWIVANPQLLAQARARYESLDCDAVINLCEAFLQLNLTSELHRIKTPTLLMVGELDALKPRHYADIIARAMPHAEYVIIPGAGHALCWEKWQVFNTLVLGFLDKHRSMSQ
ncbi:MAG: alpha/beta fold hydrolase [Chloroflexi bacterium]|nr:alpha/beta fold hydrolase [Chloroflexota bacterium]